MFRLNVKEEVKRVLKKEAPDIPSELIEEFEWELIKVPLKDINIDEKMWEKHSKSSRHKKRFVELLKYYDKEGKFKPLIAMHHNLWLADGYTRLRVYKEKGVKTVEIFWGRHPSKRTEFWG